MLWILRSKDDRNRFQAAFPIIYRDLSTRLGQDIEDLLLHVVDVLRCVAFPGHYLEGMPPEYMKDELAKERHDKERIACVVRGLQSGARIALDLRMIDTQSKWPENHGWS